MTDKLKAALAPYVYGLDQFEKVIANSYEKYPETERLLFVMVDHLDFFGRTGWHELHAGCEHILSLLQAAKNLSEIEENAYQKFIDNAKELSEIHFKEAMSDPDTLSALSKGIRITENSAGHTLEYVAYQRAEFAYRVISDFFKEMMSGPALNFDNIFRFSGDKERAWEAIDPKDRKQVTSWFVAAADYLIEKGFVVKEADFEQVARILAGKAGRELPVRLDREREEKNRNYRNAMRIIRSSLGN